MEDDTSMMHNTFCRFLEIENVCVRDAEVLVFD